MLYKWFFIVIVSSPLVKLIQGEPISCYRGEYLDQDQQRCLPCPQGTFISRNNHQFVDCKPCSEPDKYQHEVAAKPCTAVTNTIIGCSQGHFRKNYHHYDMVSKGDCEKCSVCEYDNLYEVQPCTQFSDTVCCPEPDMFFSQGKCHVYP